MHLEIYFIPKPKQSLKLPIINFLHKIQLNFTPVVDFLFSTHKYLHLALQIFILDMIRLRDLEAIL